MSERSWMDDVQAALDRVADATRSAWDSTSTERRRALDSAKRAVDDLGDVIDRAVDAAKGQWAGSKAEPPVASDDVPSASSEEE